MLGVATHERATEPISARDLLVGQSIAGSLRVCDYSCAVRPLQLELKRPALVKFPCLKRSQLLSGL
jgi:hypothetical protein